MKVSVNVAPEDPEALKHNGSAIYRTLFFSACIRYLFPFISDKFFAPLQIKCHFVSFPCEFI